MDKVKIINVVFPEVVYVYRDCDEEVNWLLVDSNIENVPISGSKQIVGIYRLENIKNIVVERKLEDVK